MKLFDVFNSRGKMFAFNAYESLFEVDEYDYEKTTRKKIFKDISDLYSDPQVLVELCTKKEIDYLNDCINGNINHSSKAWLIRMNLESKLLFDTWQDTIPDEFVDSIKQASKLYENKDNQKSDDDLTLLLGFLKVHGVILEDSIIKFGSLLFDYKEDDIRKLLEHRRVKFYTSSGYNEKHLFEYSYLEDEVEYFDIYDGIYDNNCLIPSFLEPQAYIDIFNNGFDLSKEYNNKIFEYCDKKIIDCTYALHELNTIGRLNRERKIYKKYFCGQILSTIPESIIDEVLDNYPAVVFNGKTLLEVNKMEDEIQKNFEERNRKMRKQKRACLGENDSDFFYELYFDLLDYVNTKYEINPNLNESLRSRFGIEASEVVEVSDFLYKNPSKYINEYILMNPFLKTKYRRIVEDFKRAKVGAFMLYSYDENYALMMDDDYIYMVKGLRCNIDEIIPKECLPCFVETRLLMFKGNIVFDGVISRMPVKIGNNILLNLENNYKRLKKKYSIEELVVEDDASDFEKYIIEKGDTDFMSSIKRLDKDIVKETLDEYEYDSLEELKEETIFDFKMIFEQTIKDTSTQDFFRDLLKNENTTELVFTEDDLESFYVFVYKQGDSLSYYIPDEIKEIIEEHIKINNKNFA